VIATRGRLVYVIDDDDAVRDALAMLFRTAGLKVEAYASASEFLQGARVRSPACLVLDIRMPGMSGTALHDELLKRGERVPVIFVTGHGDVPMAVAAVKKGAFDFIEKPFDEGTLLEQVYRALDEDDGRIVAQTGGSQAIELLSERERAVLDRVLAAKSSRRIGEELFITTKTVEFQRANIMRKLGVRSTAELFRRCLRPSPKS
jgi:FixJ family two-component response regulator